MKIKTLVNALVFLSLMIALSMGTLSFLQKKKIDTSIKKEFLTNDIVKMVNQREQILNDYLQNPLNEKMIQWQVMYVATVNLLQSKEFNSQEEQVILGDMREDNVSIIQNFSELIVEQSNTARKKMATDFKHRREKIKDEGENMINAAYRLSEINQQNIKAALNLAINYTIVCVVALILLILLILLLVKIKILNSLIKLNKGISILSSGNLTYKMDIPNNDEIGEIFRSFNEMTYKLNERTQQQLLLSEKLKRSNIELKQFAYIASHDLQEPLRMISSYLQLIERRYKDQLDKDGREFIDFAVNGAKRLQCMINDLLSFSRVETQANPFVTTHLDDILSKTLDNLQTVIQENHAIITHDPLPSIYADGSQMITLFQNLLSNALKFHTENPPVIHIAAKHRDNEWLFSIHDNGIGIDPKHKDELFVIFKRLVGHEYPGTGIGLAICKRILDRNQGKIWVDSELGQGSTFYFTIPDLSYPR
jgi:signal transduction histidine kinase